LAIKILNVSKFVLSRLGQEGAVSEPLDRAMLLQLASVVDAATAALEGRDWARALERTESFLWRFCDDYVELVKSRAYGSAGPVAAASAQRALSLALSTLLRLFAPFLPFAAEEVWSWWQTGSIHRASWPDAASLRAVAGESDPLVLEEVAEVLARIRKAKSDVKASMRAAVDRVEVKGPAERLSRLRGAERDLREAGAITTLDLTENADFRVDVTLATGR
jgi:valyl-tRNA synthetase